MKKRRRVSAPPRSVVYVATVARNGRRFNLAGASCSAPVAARRRRRGAPFRSRAGAAGGEQVGGQVAEAGGDHEQVRVARAATVVFGLLAVLLGIAFKGQNVAFMVGLAFAIACSANFPPLLMSIVWRRFNTAGAVGSIVTGAVLSVLLIVLSPTVWVDLFHYPAAIFPLRNPAIVSMPWRSISCGRAVTPNAIWARTASLWAASDPSTSSVGSASA